MSKESAVNHGARVVVALALTACAGPGETESGGVSLVDGGTAISGGTPYLVPTEPQLPDFEPVTPTPTGIINLTPTFTPEPTPTQISEPTATPDRVAELREDLDKAGILVAKNGVYDERVLAEIIAGRELNVDQLAKTFNDAVRFQNHVMVVEALALGTYAIFRPDGNVSLICWMAVYEGGSNPVVDGREYPNTRFVPLLIGIVKGMNEGKKPRFLSLVLYDPTVGDSIPSSRGFVSYEEANRELSDRRVHTIGIIDRYHTPEGWKRGDSGVDGFVFTRREAAADLLEGTYVDELSGEPGALDPRGVYNLAQSRSEAVVGSSIVKYAVISSGDWDN